MSVYALVIKCIVTCYSLVSVSITQLLFLPTLTCEVRNIHIFLHNIVSLTSQDHLSPLHAASKGGYTEIVDTLLKYEADPNLSTTVCSLHTYCAKNIYTILN